MQREKNQGINLICTLCNNLRHGFRKTSADKDAEVALEEAKPTKKKPTPYFSSAFFFWLVSHSYLEQRIF